ncbi:MAG: hypothetical protein M1830_005605 [Pleopsidium flavum]|nr:MAG: hypothetical protein M1830_005605 [Pleopsidium flavum]
MGNCTSAIDCTSENQPVPADPDVAGIGVIFSFIATALLTFGAIVHGYLSDSLPETTLNRLDRCVLEHLAQTCRRPWQKIQVALGRTSLAECQATDSTAVPKARNQRQDALRRFVLALSDQQLVTGLAMLIAGYTKRCSMSLYHFNIVTALAWFSSTIHLSTLTVLRDHLMDHPMVRTWRVIGMVSMLGLLLIAELMPFPRQLQMERLDTSIRLQCVFNRLKPADDPPSILALVAILAFLLISYGNKVFRLYYFNSNVSMMGWFIRQIRKGSRAGVDHLREMAETVLEADERPKSAKSAAYKKMQEDRRDSRFIHRLRTISQSQTPRIPALRRGLALVCFIFAEMSDCFLYQIIFLLFGVTYGIVQIAAYRWVAFNAPAAISGSEDELGFGQLVPLLLIALPILAAGEAYFEAKVDSSNTGYEPSHSIFPKAGHKALSTREHLVPEIGETATCEGQRVTSVSSTERPLFRPIEHQTRKSLARVDSEATLTADVADLSDHSISWLYEAQARLEAATFSDHASESSLVVELPKEGDPYSYPGLKKYLFWIVLSLIVVTMSYAFSLTPLPYGVSDSVIFLTVLATGFAISIGGST